MIEDDRYLAVRPWIRFPTDAVGEDTGGLALQGFTA